MCKRTTDDLSRNFVGAHSECRDLVQNFARVGGALITQMIKSPPYPYWGVGRDLDRCISDTHAYHTYARVAKTRQNTSFMNN